MLYQRWFFPCTIKVPCRICRNLYSDWAKIYAGRFCEPITIQSRVFRRHFDSLAWDGLDIMVDTILLDCGRNEYPTGIRHWRFTLVWIDDPRSNPQLVRYPGDVPVSNCNTETD